MLTVISISQRNSLYSSILKVLMDSFRLSFFLIGSFVDVFIVFWRKQEFDKMLFLFSSQLVKCDDGLSDGGRLDLRSAASLTLWSWGSVTLVCFRTPKSRVVWLRETDEKFIYTLFIHFVRKQNSRVCKNVLMFYLSFTDFRFMSVCFILAWCFIALPVSPSPHIKHFTSHNALLFLFSRHKLKKTIRSRVFLSLGEKQDVLSECFCVVRVSISIVDSFTKSFGVSVPVSMKSLVFCFHVLFVCCYCLKRDGRSSCGLSETSAAVRPVWWTWTQTKCQCRKKSLKKT